MTKIIIMLFFTMVVIGCMDITNNDQEYNQLPQKADLNGDGYLSPEEVAAWNSKSLE